MPLYNTATAAAVIGVTPKWLDNLLSHNDIGGQQHPAQGVARRLSLATITALALTKELVDRLGLHVPAAIRLADQLLKSPNSELAVSSWLHLTFESNDFGADVLARLSRAVEMAPSPRRGRPLKR